MVVGAEMLRHQPGDRRLVPPLDVGPEGDGARPIEMGGHGRRIDTSTQEDGHRHIGQRVRRYDLLEVGGESGHRLLRIGDDHPGVRTPIALDVHGPVPAQPVSGWQGANTGIDGLRLGHILVSQIVPQRQAIDRRPPELQQGLDLRSEGKTAFDLPIVEGLHADPVAGGEQGTLGGVPEGKGEHAAQSVETALTLLGEQMQQDLGIAVRSEGAVERLS